jgi:ketosteroid isomerase-like protein
MAEFNDFMSEREQAALAYCQGDASRVNGLSTNHAPASFFGPDGSAIRGAKAIKDAYQQGAKSFGPGGKSKLDIIQSASGGDIAYWSGLQHAEVEIDGKSKPMTLRITELFRKENGDWKLVHRHADMLKSGE